MQQLGKSIILVITIIMAFILTGFAVSPVLVSAPVQFYLSTPSAHIADSSSLTEKKYIPLLFNEPLKPPYPTQGARVNIPHFNGEVPFSETAIFWFGQVNSNSNYADVRAGYNDEELYIYLAAFDRRLWYDTDPSASELINWDAASLYLDLVGNGGNTTSTNAYRFVAQLNWWEPRSDYQASYRWNNTSWQLATIPFYSFAGWRGDSPNNQGDDKGWAMTFRIPFTSLGLSGPPPETTTWRLAVTLHDRDSDNNQPNPNQSWPQGMASDNSSTWGQLTFGLTTYSPPPVTPGGTVVIRHNLNGTKVVDGEVGGGSICGQGLDYWTEWGDTSNPGGPENSDFNIQNQSDIADWPCFSKYYITFPLDAIPTRKVVINARITLYQFGGSGAPGEAKPSLIQVLTTAGDWDESTLTWNNAPLAIENVSRSWVNSLPAFPGWPGVPRIWDVSWAVAQAYHSGQPLRLIFYSADDAYHSGKYFTSSDTGEWNAGGRPTLEVVWGDQ